MARVLCINPWIYDFAAYNMWIEPLGLLAVASALRQAGHDVGLIDCLDRHHPDAPAPRSRRDAYGCGRFAKVEVDKPRALTHVPRRWGRYGLPLDVFEAELDAQPRPDAILVTSMMTYWYPGPFEAIRRVKARWPGVLVALGGVYTTLCADHARARSGADEIAWCVESLGARDVAFYDDALLVDAAHHIYPILDGVIERGLGVRFHTPNGLHARFIERRLALNMRRAGFVTIRLGLETADPDDQWRDGGKVDDATFAQAVGALFDAGFSVREVAAYVLIGRPGQSGEKARATVAFAHQLGIQVRSAQFSPIPGTAEWQVALAAGCVAPDADPLLHNNSIYPCADPGAWEEVKQQIREGNHALLA
jgi:hypothetical protein